MPMPNNDAIEVTRLNPTKGLSSDDRTKVPVKLDNSDKHKQLLKLQYLWNNLNISANNSHQ